jgi:hypothetical protein
LAAGAVLTATAMLALPSVTSAAHIKLGSTLGVAGISYPERVDTAFWSVAQGAGAVVTVPHRGQVSVIHLRGCTEPGAGGGKPLTQFHFQTLAPRNGTSVKVRATSQALNMPVCGQGASTQTVTTFHPLYLCAAPGDYVAFNVEGGGASYVVFGDVAGAVTDSFTSAGHTNNGDTLTGTAHTDVGLLMSYVLATGHSARPYCRGK